MTPTKIKNEVYVSMIKNMYKVSIINKATFYTLPERYINKIV